MTRKTAFFEGWPCFKLNNLGLTLGKNLKFYICMAKGLKLKVRKFLRLVRTFVEVIGNKGPFDPSPLPSWIGLIPVSHQQTFYSPQAHKCQRNRRTPEILWLFYLQKVLLKTYKIHNQPFHQPQHQVTKLTFLKTVFDGVLTHLSPWCLHPFDNFQDSNRPIICINRSENVSNQ